MINIKDFLNEDQDPKAVEKVLDKLKGILMTGEEIQYIAVQKKPAINISPDCIALTNKRVIFCRPKNLGLSMEFQDFMWKEVLDCHLAENFLGSDFTVKTVQGQLFKIDYLPKSQARNLYSMAQEQEEKQQEIRRQLDLEDKRAGASSLGLASPVSSTPPPPSEPAPRPEDPVATLQKLRTMLDNGLITQEEFNNKKAEILSRM